MAQDTDPKKTPDATEIPPEGGGATKFHYYAGGEVKELDGTRVSPWLWGFWTFLIIAAVAYLFYGGAVGQSFRPGDSSAAGIARVQQKLDQQSGGRAQLTSLDLNQVQRPSGQSVDQAITAGSTVYQTYCIGCHGPNQDGNGVNAAALNPKPRNLHDGPFMQAMSYQRISTSIHKGVPGTAMPRWENTLTETEIQDVIVYVWSLTAPKPDASANSATAGVVDSPKPITPAINGDPTAHTNTAPPSISGAPVITPGANPTNPPPAPASATDNNPSMPTGPSTGNTGATPGASGATGSM